MNFNHTMIAEIKGAVSRPAQFRFSRPVEWQIERGENWAVSGPNGAGKTVLADILTGRIPLKEGRVAINTSRKAYESVKSIGFRDIYSIVDCRDAYYQQRWNADGRAATPLASTLFPGQLPPGTRELFRRFSLSGALEKHIVSLSSGELRKLLIIRALSSAPNILIIDNPFVGLDESSRGELSLMLGDMAREGGVQFILLVSDPAEIPEWVDRGLPVREMEIGLPADDPVSFDTSSGSIPGPVVIPAYGSGPSDRYDITARLESVTVRYGDKVILDRVDWEIRRGEKWALLGGNGSGKSTLLSLLYGDNPQAYANRITLFDRPRGSGESIWEIKKRIGFLNSDIHSFYLKDITALEVVLSGFYDTVGLYGAADPEKETSAREWLGAFGSAALADRKFTSLSFGEQRLVMLARTFVKCPGVLILDEPMHGLDPENRARATEVIERYCARDTVTLIYVTHYRDQIPPCVDKVKTLGG